MSIVANNSFVLVFVVVAVVLQAVTAANDLPLDNWGDGSFIKIGNARKAFTPLRSRAQKNPSATNEAKNSKDKEPNWFLIYQLANRVAPSYGEHVNFDDIDNTARKFRGRFRVNN